MSYLLQVAPNGVGPDFWPQTTQAIEAGASKIISFRFHTVISAEEHTSGIDWSHARETMDEIGELCDAWFEEHEDEPWMWQFRTLVKED